MSLEILCIGQLVTDIIATNIDYTHLGEDTKRADEITVKNGGDCMNVAIDLAKLGCKVGFSGKVGNDGFGEFLRSEFDKLQIDTRGLRVSDDVSTSSVIVLVNGQGQRIFLYYGGANDSLCVEDIDFSVMDEYRHVHIGGTFLLPRLDGEGSKEIFAAAKKRGLTTSMDVTWDTTGRWLSVIEPCLPYLDLFMPSKAEAELITGCAEPQQIAAFLRARGVGVAVIKLGEKGAYVESKDLRFHQPAFAVDVVDTTGAGDSFVAGFLSQYVMGRPLRECARFAAGTAAHCIGRLGATSGIPDAGAVFDFIKSSDGLE